MSVLDGHLLAQEWDFERHVIQQLLFPDLPTNDDDENVSPEKKKKKKNDPGQDRNLCACGSMLVAVPVRGTRRMNSTPSDSDSDISVPSIWIKVCSRSFRTKRNCKYALAKKPIAWRLPVQESQPGSPPESQTEEPSPIPPVIRAEEAKEAREKIIKNHPRPHCRRRARLCPRR